MHARAYAARLVAGGTAGHLERPYVINLEAGKKRSDASLVLPVRVTLVCAAAGAANVNSPEPVARPGRQAVAYVKKPGRPEGRKREGEAASP
ncbi:MAG: hypothetical protein OXF56_15305, partial [Rhodobacteraceae bacterium]|nr:hypothetical protein [Paracoccaceae bacterium]